MNQMVLFRYKCLSSKKFYLHFYNCCFVYGFLCHNLLALFILFWHKVVACRYVGHLKQRTLKDQMAKDPTDVIRKAILRMIPKNNLRDVSTL